MAAKFVLELNSRWVVVVPRPVLELELLESSLLLLSEKEASVVEVDRGIWLREPEADEEEEKTADRANCPPTSQTSFSS